MRSNAVFIVLVLFLFGCQKENWISSRLEGEWDVYMLEYVAESSEECDSNEIYADTTILAKDRGYIRFENESEGDYVGSGVFYIVRPSPSLQGNFEWLMDFQYRISESEEVEIIVMDGKFFDERQTIFHIEERERNKLKFTYTEDIGCTPIELTLWCRRRKGDQ